MKIRPNGRYFTFAYSTILIAISAALFVFVIEALNTFIKVREGMASWAATMSMLVAGIAELGFIIYSGETLKRTKTSGAITDRFLILLMVLGCCSYCSNIRTLDVRPKYSMVGDQCSYFLE